MDVGDEDVSYFVNVGRFQIPHIPGIKEKRAFFHGDSHEQAGVFKIAIQEVMVKARSHR